jgi:hypothetical protein
LCELSEFQTAFELFIMDSGLIPLESSYSCGFQSHSCGVQSLLWSPVPLLRSPVPLRRSPVPLRRSPVTPSGICGALKSTGIGVSAQYEVNTDTVVLVDLEERDKN